MTVGTQEFAGPGTVERERRSSSVRWNRRARRWHARLIVTPDGAAAGVWCKDNGNRVTAYPVDGVVSRVRT